MYRIQLFYRKKAAGLLIVVSAVLLGVCTTSCSRPRDVDGILSEAYVLLGEGKYDEAQLKALEAEEQLKDTDSLAARESLARLYGAIFFQQNIGDKARQSCQKALKYAVDMKDTALIVTDLYNLGLCGSTCEEAVAHLGQAAALARKHGNGWIYVAALEKSAQAYIHAGDFAKAQQCLDEAKSVPKWAEAQRQSIEFTQYGLWFVEGKLDAALQGFKSFNTDSLYVGGRLTRANAIYEILVRQGDYKNALAYKDSIYIYTDSLKHLDGSKRVEEIERTYHEKIAGKNQRFKILMWSSALTVSVVLVILFFVLKTLRLKKRQVELNDRISVLNARIAEFMPKAGEDEDPEEADRDDLASIMRLIEQKYELSLEMFRSLPEYDTLRKLNLIREMSIGNRAEVKVVYDAVVGRFSGCCSDTRQAFPGLTNDDCVFCTMSFAGCSKEVISASMGASDEALRRRKSRIKQKIPEELFIFFFSR